MKEIRFRGFKKCYNDDMNPFVYSDSNKRYHTFDYYLKKRYGSKVFKVALDGGFSCPNRDGKCGVGGCIFCSLMGSGEYAGNRKEDLETQFQKGYEKMAEKWGNCPAIAYFQAFSNTYAPLDYLKKCFEPFTKMDKVVALSIATRPDCLEDDVLDYLGELNKKIDTYIELGLQTVHDETAKFINRGYYYKTFLEAVNKLNRLGIKIVVHLINGLPNESEEMMLATVKKISSLPIMGIKFHYLSVLKGTKLEELYDKGEIKLLSKDEYLGIVSKQITYLPPQVVIQRIGTDAMASELIAPKWNSKKVAVSNDFDKLLEKEDSYQGKNYRNISQASAYSHFLALQPTKKKIAIDATLGNGYDSLFLLGYYEKVLGFDIQELAIKRSQERLKDYRDVQIIHDSFINIPKYVTEPIDCLIYNLGFLPGSDKKITTKPDDVIKSLVLTLPLLDPKGVGIIVCYPRHNDGIEYQSIKEYLAKSDYRYIETDIDNEIIIEITKK